jgi:hypothetical protein
MDQYQMCPKRFESFVSTELHSILFGQRFEWHHEDTLPLSRGYWLYCALRPSSLLGEYADESITRQIDHAYQIQVGAAKRREESIVTIVNKASSAPSIHAAKEWRLEMDQDRTKSLLETQLRLYREAQQWSLEQLQERQRLVLAKAALKRQSIQYEQRAMLLQMSRCQVKVPQKWNGMILFGRPWSVMDDWMMGDVWCGAPLALTYVLRRKKITQWKQGVLTYTYGSTSTIRGTINSTFAC